MAPGRAKRVQDTPRPTDAWPVRQQSGNSTDLKNLKHGGDFLPPS